MWYYANWPKTDGLVIAGNRVRTNAAGLRALPNSDGMIIPGAERAQIGGGFAGMSNLVSDNLADGPYIANVPRTPGAKPLARSYPKQFYRVVTESAL